MASRKAVTPVPATAPATSTQKKFLTTSEVCDIFRRDEKTIQRWRKNRKITFVRMYGRFLYPAAEINKLLDRLTVAAA